jgi:hypothetical protein
LFYDPVEQWHLQQKHIVVVTYYLYCREDRGRHTHRGSHYSSRDSRRRYLSDANLVKWNLYLEKKHRGIVSGGALITGGA